MLKPKLNLQWKTQTDSKTVFKKLEKLLVDHPRFKKLDPTYSCDFHPKDLTLNVKGQLFQAQVCLLDKKDHTLIKIDGKLAMAAALFKGQLTKVLEKEIGKVFTDLS